MRVFIVVFLLFSVVGSAIAATHVIQVGAENTVSFNPTSLTIAPGDTVNFDFRRPGDSGKLVFGCVYHTTGKDKCQCVLLYGLWLYFK